MVIINQLTILYRIWVSPELKVIKEHTHDNVFLEQNVLFFFL